MRHITSLAAVVAIAAACARAGSPSADSTAAASSSGTAASDQSAKAAKVANAISAKPAAADSILKANGYTAESFEREMYAIAADSARSAAYVAAKSR